MKRSFAAALAAGAVLVAGTPALAQSAAAPSFGPHGYGAVKLGMTAKQAKATGKITHKLGDSASPCTGWDLKTHPTGKDSVGLYLSKRRGVAVVFAARGMKTREGIGLGATMTQIKKAYPNVTSPADTNPRVAVPGNSRAYYEFMLDAQGRLQEMALGLKTQDCVS
ncbi:hypothetical protein [Nonomuraea longicatena]|uniref:Lipoprotein n=1 Tax=Nonomuraea longicatena TaxID=83682 RepID=A0ABN1Q9S4_9ACTN